MTHFDLIIVGGGPSGIVLGATARKRYPKKTALMITPEARGMVPCGIPYVFHALGDIEKNVMGPQPFVAAGGVVVNGRVVAVAPEKRLVTLGPGESYGYDKLVFATGSRPKVPTFLPGHALAEGVVYVPKSYAGIDALRQALATARRVIVLGSGFTAVELAEQLAGEPSREVHLVFRAAHCLQRSFSPELAAGVDRAVAGAGVQLHAHSQVSEILGEAGKAVGIRLADGCELPADVVVVAMGYEPDTDLAAQAGIPLNTHGQIVVDTYQRTSVEGIFAVGDCAQNTGFLTGSVDCIMLASTGTAEARVLGHNLYGVRIERDFPGTLSVFCTEIVGMAFASAGLRVEDALAANMDVVCGAFEDVDRHPGTLPGTRGLSAKLTVMRSTGQIVGGELCGGKSVGEMINTVALAIQKHVSVYELLSFQIGTHPLLTTAPTKPVLIKAAEAAIAMIDL